jgi:YHS domain-containing protein
MRQKLGRRQALTLATLIATCSMAISLCPAVAQTSPVAIKGYDPVAYFTDGKPVRGLPEIDYEWDAHRYHFATAQHRDLFKADPARYAPQFGNFCAMALSKGEFVIADPENWQINDGKLYVFGKPAGPELFRKDLAANIDKANGNRPLLPKNESGR